MWQARSRSGYAWTTVAATIAVRDVVSRDLIQVVSGPVGHIPELGAGEGT